MESTIIQFSGVQISIILFFLLIFQFLSSIWIKSRLEKSIQHEYDKKLEEYKFLQLQKQKSEIIGRFFAKWIKYRGQERTILDKKELLDYYEELNRMSFEISLWISNDEILKEVMKRFQNQESAKDVRSLIGEFRKLILNIESKDFNIQDITIWPTNKIAEEMGLINIKK